MVRPEDREGTAEYKDHAKQQKAIAEGRERSAEAAEESAKDDAKADAAMQASLDQKKGRADIVATKLIEGDKLTPGQSKALEKEPGFKILVKSAFRNRGHDPADMFAEAVIASHNEAKAVDKETGKPLLEPVDRLRMRRHVTQETGKLGGIGGVEAQKGIPNQTINILFPAAFYSKDNGHEPVTVEVHPAPGSDSDDSGSSDG